MTASAVTIHAYVVRLLAAAEDKDEAYKQEEASGEGDDGCVVCKPKESFLEIACYFELLINASNDANFFWLDGDGSRMYLPIPHHKVA